jgi:hypothetical protein
MMHAYDNQTIKHAGRAFLVEYFHDADMGAPWVEHDGHGIIRSTCSHYGRPEKKPGEVIIASDRGHYWLYNIEATTQKAQAEGWSIANPAPGMTRRQIVAAAVARDMAHCAGFLNDNWHWCGITVTLLDSDGEKTEAADSLWGMASDDADYLEGEARNMAEGLTEGLRMQWRQALREARERKYWSARDVVTA